MKIPLFILAVFLFVQTSSAQIWELSSNKNIEMTSKTQTSEQTDIVIDSNRVVLTTGPTNFYYDITNQKKEGKIYSYQMLDKNDDTVTAVFSPVGKVFDYHVHQFFIRYMLDKVTKTEPPLSDSALAQLKADSIKKVLADTSEVDAEPKEDTTVYDNAEVMPEYPGGKSEMMAYLAKNVKYPKAAKEQNIHGFLTVTAIVEKDGSLSHVKVVKDIGAGCGAEAVRVIKNMPHWSPAENKGESVRVKVSIPVSMMPPPK